jgi:adenylate cyclase
MRAPLPLKRWLDVLVSAFLLLLAVGVALQDFRVIDQLRNLVFDAFQRQAPRPYQPLPVRIVDIDEESLRRIGQWPWPRDLVARLVDRLAETGAATVALDIIFAEPDRFSPPNLVRVWQDRPELAAFRATLAQLPDSDAVLAESLARTPSVLAFALSERADGSMPAPKAGFASAGDDPLLFARRFSGAVVALPALEAAAAGNGAANYFPDVDNTVRRAPLLAAVGGQLYPSFAAEALRVAQGASTYTIKSSGASQEESFGEQTGIAAVRIGAAIVPTDAEGRLLLHDTGHVPARFVPAWRVLEADFDPGQVEGMIVLVGSTAEALKDVRTTPLAAVMPGVEIHAMAIEQMLAQEFLHRPDWIRGAETVGFTLLGLILIGANRYVGALWSLAIALVAWGGAFGVSWYGFTRLKYLIDPLYPSLITLVVYVSGTLIGYLRSERERRFVRNVFSRYLSPVLVDQVSRHPERLRLGGEMRELTLLFSDVRGFTGIAERLNPQELTALMNRFLTPLTAVIQESGGFIDKYMGDCIMAFWNAPLDVKGHAAKAIAASLGMRAALARLNEELKEEALAGGRAPFVLAAGIGLNSGRACVGNMGSEQRMEYSVVGDMVNVASRLEGLSRAYGVDIVVGEDTAAQAPDAALLEIDLVRVKGRVAPLKIFTVIGDEGAATTADFQQLKRQHDALLSAYRRQDWSAARAALADCRPLAPTLGEFYDVYAQRIAGYEQAPPPPDWDGAFAATTKQG